MWIPPLLIFKLSKNSCLASLPLCLNTPDAFVVTIAAPECLIPLQETQLCVATIVTITPKLFSHTLSTP
jgi:hypothetical protein